jgi:hypothetical protein
MRRIRGRSPQAVLNPPKTRQVGKQSHQTQLKEEIDYAKEKCNFWNCTRHWHNGK